MGWKWKRPSMRQGAGRARHGGAVRKEVRREQVVHRQAQGREKEVQTT